MFKKIVGDRALDDLEYGTTTRVRVRRSRDGKYTIVGVILLFTLALLFKDRRIHLL